MLLYFFRYEEGRNHYKRISLARAGLSRYNQDIVTKRHNNMSHQYHLNCISEEEIWKYDIKYPPRLCDLLPFDYFFFFVGQCRTLGLPQ